MTNSYKKFITGILVLTFVFSPVFAIPARAQWIDISTAAKDYGLDALGWEIVNRIISRMSASTVKWINSGFKGKPAYVTDPNAYFTDLGDKVAGEFIIRNANLNFLCADMSTKVRLALANNYNRNEGDRWRCTLTGVIDNVDDFMNDFEKGGWDGFFKLTQEQQNNPIGAYIQAEGELARRIAEKVGEKDKELSWGSGFMSQKECVKRGAPTIRTVQEGGVFQLQDDGTSKFVGGITRQVTEEGPCLKERTVTPGETISNQLNKQLGLGNDKLAVADEINEIISGLLNQLVSRVIGGVTGGLRGASEKSSTDNNQVLTDQLSSSTTTVDYFGNAQDTSVLDRPLPTTTATMPTDRDCSGTDINTLNSMAQNNAGQTGTTFEDALTNLDCPPAGIN